MDVIHRYDPRAQPHRPPGNIDEAIELLREGNDRFAEIVARIRSEVTTGKPAAPLTMISSLSALGLAAEAHQPAPSQTPFALVLGCADSRAAVEHVFGQDLNDLFVVRVAGNVLGLEGLGSLAYAWRHFHAILRLGLVLGHTQCGAVAAAAKVYLHPHSAAELGFTYSLGTVVDRLMVAVRKAALRMEDTLGRSLGPRDEDQLASAAVYINAAMTAADVQRELDALRVAYPDEQSGAPWPHLPVFHGVYNLANQQVEMYPATGATQGAKRRPPLVGQAPRSGRELTQYASRVVRGLARYSKS